MKTPQITAVKALKKYSIEIQFNDGLNGTYDVSHLAGKGVFKSWDEHNNFFKVDIDSESGAITWPGELDIDSIAVYCAIKNIDVQDYLKPAVNHAAN